MRGGRQPPRMPKKRYVFDHSKIIQKTLVFADFWPECLKDKLFWTILGTGTAAVAAAAAPVGSLPRGRAPRAGTAFSSGGFPGLARPGTI